MFWRWAIPGLLDAPVSGGVRAARVGKLTLKVGGDSAELERVSEMLGAMASTIHHFGALGFGHAMKALNNLGCPFNRN